MFRGIITVSYELIPIRSLIFKCTTLLLKEVGCFQMFQHIDRSNISDGCTVQHQYVTLQNVHNYLIRLYFYGRWDVSNIFVYSAVANVNAGDYTRKFQHKMYSETESGCVQIIFSEATIAVVRLCVRAPFYSLRVVQVDLF